MSLVQVIARMHQFAFALKIAVVGKFLNSVPLSANVGYATPL